MKKNETILNKNNYFEGQTKLSVWEGLKVELTALGIRLWAVSVTQMLK